MIRETNVDQPLLSSFVIHRESMAAGKVSLNFECAMGILCEDLSAMSDNFLILLRNKKSKLD